MSNVFQDLMNVLSWIRAYDWDVQQKTKMVALPIIWIIHCDNQWNYQPTVVRYPIFLKEEHTKSSAFWVLRPFFEWNFNINPISFSSSWKLRTDLSQKFEENKRAQQFFWIRENLLQIFYYVRPLHPRITCESNS